MTTPLPTCPRPECETPIGKVTGKVDPRGGHVYVASPCGHAIDRDLARAAHDAGRPVWLEPVTGAGLLQAERARQRSEEGYSEEHDAEHAQELSWAAWSYLDRVAASAEGTVDLDAPPPPMWPWEAEDWKPGPTRIRMLVKAGALIAAEIDRLLAKGEHP